MFGSTHSCECSLLLAWRMLTCTLANGHLCIVGCPAYMSFYACRHTVLFVTGRRQHADMPSELFHSIAAVVHPSMLLSPALNTHTLTACVGVQGSQAVAQGQVGPRLCCCC